jgi:DNA-binding NarL/FixJ family response regulator
MIKIALVEDHSLFRTMLRKFIEVTLGWLVIMEACNGADCIQQLTEAIQQPDILLMDISMPVMDGRQATAIITGLFPSIKIIGISSLLHEHVINDMLTKGAKGFISKSADEQVFLKCVHSVMDNHLFIETVLEENNDNTEMTVIITDKQKQFLRLCATDKGYKEIANIMHISYSTVDSYRAELFKKLNVNSRQGLVIYAFKQD